MSAFDEGFNVGYDEGERYGLNPWPRWIHAYATGALFHWGFNEPARPDIVSGYRSPVKQRQMRNRWDAGDRVGLVARPAVRSWHTTGQAWDVENGVAGFPWYRWTIMQYIKPRVNVEIRWGGNFSSPDPVHFDVPIADQPPSIYDI